MLDDRPLSLRVPSNGVIVMSNQVYIIVSMSRGNASMYNGNLHWFQDSGKLFSLLVFLFWE